MLDKTAKYDLTKASSEALVKEWSIFWWIRNRHFTWQEMKLWNGCICFC